MNRHRLADEKTRLAKEREQEYRRSIVPSPCSIGLEEVQADDVFAEVSHRVRRECQYLCLIPAEAFEVHSIDGKTPKAKRHMEWLRCASILVVTSLNLDSPNPIGWECHEDSFTLSRLQSGEVAPSYWILGAFCRLRGAQPWQATRSYIASKVYELLEVSILLIIAAYVHIIYTSCPFPTLVIYLRQKDGKVGLQVKLDGMRLVL